MTAHAVHRYGTDATSDVDGAAETNYTRMKDAVLQRPPHKGEMPSMRAIALAVSALAVSLIVMAWPLDMPAFAQAAGAPAAGGPPMDDLQKSDRIYQFRKAAASGPERGREIFYYKCWFCHNEFTKDIPKLTGLFQHPTLLSGAPVNDETVKNQIRNGSADMAAYKYTLSEADIDDLVSFLRQECCWNSDAPPPNPAYRAR